MSRGDASAAGTPHAHARTWALIPWLVNGRADEAQRAEAEGHLAGCAECRAELSAQRHLHAALQDDGPHATQGLDPEHGLQRLLGRLDQLPTDQDLPTAVTAMPAMPAMTAAPAAPTAVTGGGVAAVADAPMRRGGRLNGALAAAVVAQAIGLALLSLQLLRSDDTPYQTLSTPPAVSVNPTAPAFRVVPDPALSLQQWQALLDATQLRVVDGPNTAGAYVVAARAPGPAAAPQQQVLSQLRAMPGVRLAEPLGPVP